MNKSKALTHFTTIIIAALTLLLSCTSAPDAALDQKPADLLSEKEMVGILIDVHITESALSLKNFNRDSSLVLYAYYKDEIFKEHHVTEQQFKDSYDYYSKHSDELNHIYEIVVDSISIKEASGKLN
ncbi:MAG: DUF4296 domain-containing protein [Cytophaga sp.]|uniref:DUF4296 domain-containing protein n=1 Tax=Cytophaga sp. TaxID=29535 RepID=UPI003F810956